MNEKSTPVTVRSVGSTRMRGLRHIGQDDIEFRYKNDDLGPVARDLAGQIIRYIERGINIHDGEKMSLASSVIKFERQDGVLLARALDLRHDTFLPFIDDLLLGWKDQCEVCKSIGSKYSATNLADLVLVSPDILTAGAIREAVRYPCVSPGSGWWIFGRSYSGNPDSMLSVHIGDVLLRQPEAHQYLALEPGFCFAPDAKPTIWFDADVAKEERS